MYMLMVNQKNVWQNQNMKIVHWKHDKFHIFEIDTSQAKSLSQIKRGLNLGNACYCLVQNSLSSYLYVKNINCDCVVLYGCETLYVTLPEHRMGYVQEPAAEEDDWTKSGRYMKFEKFA
jgi:hypothetical protein